MRKISLSLFSISVALLSVACSKSSETTDSAYLSQLELLAQQIKELDEAMARNEGGEIAVQAQEIGQEEVVFKEVAFLRNAETATISTPDGLNVIDCLDGVWSLAPGSNGFIEGIQFSNHRSLGNGKCGVDVSLNNVEAVEPTEVGEVVYTGFLRDSNGQEKLLGFSTALAFLPNPKGPSKELAEQEAEEDAMNDPDPELTLEEKIAMILAEQLAKLNLNQAEPEEADEEELEGDSDNLNLTPEQLQSIENLMTEVGRVNFGRVSASNNLLGQGGDKSYFVLLNANFAPAKAFYELDLPVNLAEGVEPTINCIVQTVDNNFSPTDTLGSKVNQTFLSEEQCPIIHGFSEEEPGKMAVTLKTKKIGESIDNCPDTSAVCRRYHLVTGNSVKIQGPASILKEISFITETVDSEGNPTFSRKIYEIQLDLYVQNRINDQLWADFAANAAQESIFNKYFAPTTSLMGL